MMNRIVHCVAAAIENENGDILLATRPEGKIFAGAYEFPGGKLENGETPEQALIREIREELDIDLDATGLEPLHFVSHGYEDFHLVMPVYKATKWAGDINPQEGQTYKWVSPEALPTYKDKVPAANVPLLEYIAGL